MVEVNSSDQSSCNDRQDRRPIEKPAPNSLECTPEGQQVRNATGGHVEAIKAANPNASDGSVKNWAQMTGVERYAHAEQNGQEESFVLVDQKPLGIEVVAARQMVPGVKLESQEQPIVQNLIVQNLIVQNLAEVDNRPIKNYNYQVKQHGEHQVIETGLQYQVGKPPEVTERSLFERIGALPLKQQAFVVGAGIKAYNGELTHQQFRIGIGVITGLGDGVVGLAEGAESLGTAIIGVAQFSRDVMTNDLAAVDTAGKAGESLGKLMVGGIHVFSAADAYLGSVEAATNDGDYTKALRDVSWLGQQINSRWESMTPEEKTRLTTKLAVENLGDLALIVFRTAKIAKSEKIIETLEAMGTEASELGAGQRDKAGKFISRLLDELMPQPMGVTPDERLMPIPRDHFKNEANALMSKVDDSLGANARKPKELQSGKPEKPPEVTKEALDNHEGLAKLAKKFGINMPPKDTYVFVGEKDAVSADAAVKRLGISVEQLKSLDATSLIAQKLERVPDYRDAFFNAHPGLIPVADRITVHHAIPKWLLKRHEGLFSAAEVNDVESLRGIYKLSNNELHNDKIHNAWERFNRAHPKPSRQEVLKKVEELDEQYGNRFVPTERR